MLGLIIGDIHKMEKQEDKRVQDDDSGAIVAKLESEEDEQDDKESSEATA